MKSVEKSANEGSSRGGNHNSSSRQNHDSRRTTQPRRCIRAREKSLLSLPKSGRQCVPRPSSGRVLLEQCGVPPMLLRKSGTGERKSHMLLLRSIPSAEGAAPRITKQCTNSRNDASTRLTGRHRPLRLCEELVFLARLRALRLAGVRHLASPPFARMDSDTSY